MGIRITPLVVFLFAFFLGTASHIQSNVQLTPKTNTTSNINIVFDTLKTKTIIDTLKVQFSQHLSKENGSNNMPWIAAIFVGVLTVIANYIIARINKNTAIRNIKDQVETSTQIANLQIESTKEIALQQISNSQKLASHGFNATLKTQNRQQWINLVRDTLTDFSTHSKILNAEFQEAYFDRTRQIELHEKVTRTRVKLTLLLNPKIETHNNLLEAISELLTVLDLHLYESKGTEKEFKNLNFSSCNEAVIKSGRDLLYSEWQKIQDVS